MNARTHVIVVTHDPLVGGRARRQLRRSTCRGSWDSARRRMSPLDGIRYAAGSVRGTDLRRRSPSSGVAIGVSSVMVLTSLGEGPAHTSPGSSVARVEPLIVVPGKTETEKEAPIFSQAPHDLPFRTPMPSPALHTCAPGRAAPARQRGGRLGRPSPSREGLGTTGELLRIRRLEMMTGRFFPRGIWTEAHAWA